MSNSMIKSASIQLKTERAAFEAERAKFMLDLADERAKIEQEKIAMADDCARRIKMATEHAAAATAQRDKAILALAQAKESAESLLLSLSIEKAIIDAMAY